MGRELKVHVHPSRVQRWRHIVEIVAFIGAGLWAIYVFVYQERIKPAGAPPELQTVLSVEHLQLYGGKEFVKVNVRMRNIGHIPFSLAGMVVNVYGLRFGNITGEHVETPLNGVTELSRTLLPSRPSLLYSFFDTWKAFGATKPFRGIDPGGDFVESFAFGVKAGGFDAAKIEWIV